ncbi:MAG TPA: heavy metal-binding domain-containing protein [Actinospica sp.]|jgi:uncharacterized protein YbjQ (UPF0145 family)|nr:heavy metal-binding domain-containing protein [Actinospica sp.]
MADVAKDPQIKRLTRLRNSRGWSFPSPVGGFTATEIAGFDPVGQVFGATVAYLGPSNLGLCFVPNGSGSRGGQRGGARSCADPSNPLLAKITAARGIAIERAVAECQALGGDGIIGMRVNTTGIFTESVEVIVEGTAVRARSLTRPPEPFTTHVSGPDLARLLRSGWMPFALVSGLSMAACHFEDAMFQQTRRGVGTAANREVTGYTRLVNDARREARAALDYAVHRQQGEGAVIDGITLQFSERECPDFDQRADYLAQATILGTAIIPFDRTIPTTPRPPLTIMRLDARTETGTGAAATTRPGPEPESGPSIVPKTSLGDKTFAYLASRQRMQ